MSMSFKAFTLVLAATAASFGFASGAMAYDGENRDAAIGIIGGVISGAIEADREKQEAKAEARDHERQCVRLHHRCKEGSDWACGKYEEICGD